MSRQNIWLGRARLRVWPVVAAVIALATHAVPGRRALAAEQSDLASSEQINPPLGPYTNPKPEDFAGSQSFGVADRVVLTPYFYWYDVYTSAHIVDADGSDALTDHPPTLDDFSYKSRDWHQKELMDMIDAGIDVLLPVYWGEPSQRRPGQPILAQPWSYAGIPPLVDARSALLAEGKKPPAIGMFYDTSTLEYNAAGRKIDLTTPYGRQWFYESVRDFFSLVPARHWAMIDGGPIIFLYSASFAANHDQTCIDFLRSSFARDFGGRTPFIVREISWQVQADDAYAWGGALGLKNPGLASLGPGYDHSAVPGRDPLVVDREGGAFFERNWTRFLRRPSPRVMIETWNEYHEGTDVAASREYGRQYIELNRKYVEWFKQGARPPLPPGPYSDFKSVEVILQQTNIENGIIQLDQPDGRTTSASLGGQPCRVIVKTQYGGRYVYMRIDDSFKWAETMLVDIEVEYFDSAVGSFRIEFDGSDTNAPFQGAYTSSARTVALRNTQRWERATFRLTGAHFLNSQNGGADFRLAVNAESFGIRRVTVTRLGLPNEAGALLRGWQQDFGKALDARWTVVDAAPGTFAQANNMLVVSSALGGFPRFMLALTEADPAVQEILARVRVVACAGTGFAMGGPAFAMRATPDTGLSLQFSAGMNGDRKLSWHGVKTQPGPSTDFAWQTNLWYWIRVRHQTNTISLYPDLLARVWPADGESIEPAAWTSWWDYCPGAPAQKGWSGIAGGVGGTGVMEWDYLLVKADGLPEITVRLPGLKPARPHLSALSYTAGTGFELELAGTARGNYLIEASTDFAAWSVYGIVADGRGRAIFRDAAALSIPSRFYRARIAP